ncbi:antibiotic biosynthesis monooxygenase [Streptomyces sp. MA15]|uniref:antibiotic biosynthesis monooxygenase n=1 Tax=Streptomyces sp. MA15 TaxID=3055061 RepID=UPI0025B25FD7|nr:antibiotic biosynthesis monooxygenase [Streptomyces sp. MA15]MDN3270366.1 antibiotic biosynthesis monooxygenase [Streptomyces sp. MA15]
MAKTAEPERRSAPVPSGEVGLLIARQVDPGHEEDFEKWAHGVLTAASAFPGHLGYGLFRPSRPGEPWCLVHRFRDAEAHARWDASPDRAAWFRRADGHHWEVDRRHLSGIEGWFVPPGRARATPPPRWKMLVTAVLGIYPISLFSGTVVQPHLMGLPLLLRTGLVALLFSGLMSYAVMPMLTWALKKWLHPS